MKNYSENVILEVKGIMKDNSGNLALVKKDSKGSIELVHRYNIVNKYLHSFFLIDDEDVAECLITMLLDQNVEIFDGFNHLKRMSPKNVPRPVFWPEDKPWPPKKDEK